MTNVDRRTFLALSGVAGLAGALGLSGCGRAGPVPDATGTITWWDQFQPLETLQQRTFDAVTGRLDGVTVDYTVYDPAALGQALQLAQQSGQVPDVFTNGFGVPELVLVENEWVRPIELSAEARARIPEGSLLEGVHTFDGELYSFPLFTPRQHATLTYFDRRAVEAAGGDPDEGPRTWDEFRALANAMTTSSSYGWIEGLALTDRLRQHVIDLATGAGAVLSFSGNGADTPGVADARTGEYPFDTGEFLDVFEFLGSLVSDGVMFPSSTSLDVRTARARWVGGDGGLFFDGAWNVGVLNGQYPDALGTLGLTDMPTPDGVVRAMNGPVGGSFWLSSSSTDAGAVNEIFSYMTTERYARELAAAMDQPPADVAAVLAADVPDAYKRAVSLMQQNVRLAPSPIVRNPAVGAVLSEMKQIRPNLGEIAQGYLGGNVDDLRSELRSYRSRLSAERDRAIGVVRSRGLEVSLDDWRFDDLDDQTPGSTGS